MQMGDKIISDSRPYFIAEIGVNHENDIEMAKHMISAAQTAGADAIKFQLYRWDRLAAEDSPKYWLDDRPDESQREFFKRVNKFYISEAAELIDYAKWKGISCLFSVFDNESLEFVKAREDVPAIKVASSELTNDPMLERLKNSEKPVLVSTGASYLPWVERAVNILDSTPVALLHCVSCYPSPIDTLSLRALSRMAAAFPNYTLGWSDHTHGLGHVPCIVAAALGARIFEKHFTIEALSDGENPDHGHSFTPLMFRAMVDDVTAAVRTLGQPVKTIQRCERQFNELGRRRLYARRAMEKGERITRADVVLLRGRDGLRVEYLDLVDGHYLMKPLERGDPIEWGAF